MIEIRLPKPGPEIEEATITSWECTEGDKIGIGDILAIIKTPVGSFKVAAEEQGILESILQHEGDSINFDEPIAMLRPELKISDYKRDEAEEDEETITIPEVTDEEPAPEVSTEPSTPEIDSDEVIELREESVIEEEETPFEEETEEQVAFEDTPDEEKNPDLEEESENEEEPYPEPMDGAIPFEESEEDEEPETEDAWEDTVDEEIFGESTESADFPEEAIPEEPEIEADEKEEASEPETSGIPEDLGLEISPAAMKLADQAGIDLTTVMGSGENGKIHYIDVENAIWERAKANQSRKEEESLEGEEAQEEQPNQPEEEAPEEPLETEDAEPQPVSDDETVSEDMEAEEDTYPEEDVLSSEEAQASEQPETTEDEGEILPESETPREDSEGAPDLDEVESQGVQDHGSFEDNEISIQYNMERKEDLIIPFNNVKKAYAELLTEANKTVPQLVLFAEIDFTNAERWREEFNIENKTEISVTDLMVKVCGHALALMPEFNAYVRADRVVLKRSINIAVTTALEEGVVTPVVPDVYHKSLQKVSEVIRKNTSFAAESRVVLDYETAFTVTNLGMCGVKRFIPMVTPPQSACLAVGEVAKKVVPVNDFAGVRNFAEVTLACDHRAIDGPTAARFLQIIRSDLESMIPGDDPDWIKGNEQLRLI